MIINLITIAIAIFFIYNVLSIISFSIPHSLSMTYYLYKEKYGIGWLFCVMMVTIVALLLPCWLTISEGSTFQFLSFLAPSSLLFVAAAPAFLNDGMESKVHTVSAYLAAACSILWVILVTPFWYDVLIWLLCVALIALCTKTVKKSLIYWLEMIAFGSTLTAIYGWAKLIV